MAWLTLADGTGTIECDVFPNAYERLAETSQAHSSLREGAFVVARGRLAQQEATGSKLFIDAIVNLHPGPWRSALVISSEESAELWAHQQIW